jgi:hypothetical protein
MVGIETIIKKLRPNAEFTLSNNTFSYYKDDTGLPEPSWEEIMDVFYLELKEFKKTIDFYEQRLRK